MKNTYSYIYINAVFLKRKKKDVIVTSLRGKAHIYIFSGWSNHLRRRSEQLARVRRKTHALTFCMQRA